MDSTTPLNLGKYHYCRQQQILQDTLGNEVSLRFQSLKVLQLLASHANQVVSKQTLFTQVWPNTIVTDDSLVQCVADIRRAIEDKSRNILQTLPRRGYRLNIQASSLANAKNRCEYHDVSPFIGRQQELQDLQQLLAKPDCRLVTLLGLSGVGKSRLARVLGKILSLQQPSTVHFVSLASLQHNNHIPEAIALALNIALHDPKSHLDQLVHHLKNQTLLLILDNIEHLLPNLTNCIYLLQNLPQLKIVMTSRLPTQIPGEWLYTMSGLALTPHSQKKHSDACELFIQLACRANHAFTTNQQTIDTIQHICHSVGALPLAIEITAKWIQHLSCDEILKELKQPLLINTTDDTHLPSPPSALASVLQQNWQILTTREKEVMAAIALFRCEFSREAASAIIDTTLPELSSLISKSMIYRSKKGYLLHESMRQLTNQWRQKQPGSDYLLQSFLNYHLQRASLADAHILGKQQFMWLNSLEQELGNYRACLQHCHSHAKKQQAYAHLGLQLSSSLGWYWFLSSRWKEGRDWAEKFLAHPAPHPPTTSYVLTLITAGGLATLMDDYTIANKQLIRGVNMAREINHLPTLARGLSILGILRRLQSRYAEAITIGNESMALFKQTKDDGGYLFNLGGLGQSLSGMGKYQQAIDVFEECLLLNPPTGHTISLPHSLVNLGLLQCKLGKLDTARIYLQRAIDAAENCGIRLYRAQALCTFAWVELSDNHYDKAHDLFQQSAKNYLQLGDRKGLADVMDGLASCESLKGNITIAAQFMGGAKGLRRQLPIAVQPEMTDLVAEANQRIQQSLSPAQYSLHTHLGLSMKTEAFFET